MIKSKCNVIFHFICGMFGYILSLNHQKNVTIEHHTIAGFLPWKMPLIAANVHQ